MFKLFYKILIEFLCTDCVLDARGHMMSKTSFCFHDIYCLLRETDIDQVIIHIPMM